jgi:spore germination protein GerM
MSSPRDRKRLNKENPRRSPVPPKKKPEGKPRYDRTTVVLSAVAGLLLILVIVFLDGRTAAFLFPGRAAGKSGGETVPTITRVNNEREDIDDNVPELGTPERQDNLPADTGVAAEPENAGGGETTARLFFVRVSDEGKISLKSVLRSVPADKSPLTTAIRSLIDGPRPGELSNDVLSLVPDGSELIGARIEGGTAFLDFNEQFRFNALGLEGYKAQVEQIVYTATEFPTVEKVQFLVEGQRIDYLGGEGFWVGGPLGRDDF